METFELSGKLHEIFPEDGEDLPDGWEEMSIEERIETIRELRNDQPEDGA